MTPDTPTQAAARLVALAKAAPAGPYTLDASDGAWAHEAFVRAPSWGVVARTGLGPSLPHWDGPQRAVAALFAACDPQTITSICTALQEAHAELDALRADAERYRLLRRGQRWSVVNGIGDVLRADALDAAIDIAREEGAQHAKS